MSFLLIQVPVYAFLVSNVLKMASRSEKENTVHRISRSRVPVSSKNSTNFAKYRTDKMIGIIDRQPLSEIQTTTDGGMTNADTKRPRKNSVKKETSTVLTKVSPKGSVYQLVKSKTTTKSKNSETKHNSQDYVDLDFKNVTLRKHHETHEALKDCNQKRHLQRASTLTIAKPKKVLETRSKSADRSSRIPKSIFQLSTFDQNNMRHKYSRNSKLMEKNSTTTTVLTNFSDEHFKNAEKPSLLPKLVYKKPKMLPDTQHSPPISYTIPEKYFEKPTNQGKTMAWKLPEFRSKSAERPSMIPKPGFNTSNLTSIALNKRPNDYTRTKDHLENSTTQTTVVTNRLETRSKSAEHPSIIPKHEFNLNVASSLATNDQNNRPSLYSRMKEHLERPIMLPNEPPPTKLLKYRSNSAEPPSLIPKPLSTSKTPTLVPVAQHNRVKNIKRSLKRPSSRELQKRNSSEADIQAEPTLQRDTSLQIKCSITLDSLNLYSPQKIRELTLTYERRIINHLLVSCQGLRNAPLICPIQRSVVVNWMVKLNGYQVPSSKSPQILQVAVRHLDQVLAMGQVPIDKIQLLAAACFWLAQKQCAKPRSASTFAKSAAYAFTGVDLRAAERYVLRILNWPQIPVVADDFVPLLVLLCSPSNPEPLQTATTFFCTAAMLDADLSACPADLLAIAAVINSVLVLKDSGDIKALGLCPIYRSASKSGRLREIRFQLMRLVLVMSDESCQCREPYVQHARAPHLVAPRLAAAIIERRAEFRGGEMAK